MSLFNLSYLYPLFKINSSLLSLYVAFYSNEVSSLHELCIFYWSMVIFIRLNHGYKDRLWHDHRNSPLLQVIFNILLFLRLGLDFAITVLVIQKSE